ncbi:uncharacterized protein LOC143803871 [Ranitomeya variabilis]|uniref:uncharacterized protein LOC143803871 n=1 Tax=Ranitomeya variabilis TaxID=490064 RepID=UPI004057A632
MLLPSKVVLFEKTCNSETFCEAGVTVPEKNLAVTKEILTIKCDAAKKELESIKELNHNSHKYNSESLNKTPETIIQAEEHQSIYNICDIASNAFENIIQNDPEVNTNFLVSNSENGNLSLTGNEIQKIDESKVEVAHEDANNLQHVYNITDKGHLSEEQKDESGLSENKQSFPTVEQNIRGSCDERCTEEIPVNKTCLNVVDEYEERTANLSKTMQEKEMAETIKMLPDYKIPTVCSEEASLQTDSSLQKSEDGIGEEMYIVIDKPEMTDYGQGVLKNETHSAESQLLSQTREQLISEQCTARDSSPAANSPSCVFEDSNNYYLPSLNRQISDINTQSCSNDQIQMDIEDPMLQTTENSPGVCGHSLLSELTEKIDLKSVESKDIAKHCMDMVTSNTSVNTIEREKKNKCLGQETIFTTSLSSQDPVDNLNLQSVLDKVDCNAQALHYDENADVFNVKNLYFDVRKNGPLDIKKDTNMEETIECDVNAEGKLCTDNHCQLTDQTSDQGDVEEETVCIKENENIAAGCMSQKVGSKASSKEEKSKPNGKSPINLTNVTKLVYLPGSDLRDRLNISPSNKTKLSCQDVISKEEHVPRNADQAIYNSSLPIRATFLENTNLAGKQNLCPAMTESVRSYLINLPNSTSTEVTVTNKDNYDISSIQQQISAIERFLFNNKLNRSRKRKSEDTGIAED